MLMINWRKLNLAIERTSTYNVEIYGKNIFILWKGFYKPIKI